MQAPEKIEPAPKPCAHRHQFTGIGINVETRAIGELHRPGGAFAAQVQRRMLGIATGDRDDRSIALSRGAGNGRGFGRADRR